MEVIQLPVDDCLKISCEVAINTAERGQALLRAVDYYKQCRRMLIDNNRDADTVMLQIVV